MVEMLVDDEQNFKNLSSFGKPVWRNPLIGCKDSVAFCAGFRIQLELFYGLLALTVGAS
jgi:hypothetical protein